MKMWDMYGENVEKYGINLQQKEVKIELFGSANQLQIHHQQSSVFGDQKQPPQEI